MAGSSPNTVRKFLEQLDAKGLPAILRIRYKRYSRYTSPFRPLAAS
jgi:hypothetical protein